MNCICPMLPALDGLGHVRRNAKMDQHAHAAQTTPTYPQWFAYSVAYRNACSDKRRITHSRTQDRDKINFNTVHAFPSTRLWSQYLYGGFH